MIEIPELPITVNDMLQHIKFTASFEKDELQGLIEGLPDISHAVKWTGEEVSVTTYIFLQYCKIYDIPQDSGITFAFLLLQTFFSGKVTKDMEVWAEEVLIDVEPDLKDFSLSHEEKDSDYILEGLRKASIALQLEKNKNGD